VTTLPLLNSAFRQGKGTGDLFVIDTSSLPAARRPTCRRREQRRSWGRQTMLTTVRWRRRKRRLTNAFSAEFG
jgi:hypothetical protein